MQYAELPPMDCGVIGATSATTVESKIEDCRTCGGAGWVRAVGHVPVIQDGRRVGTVPPSFDPGDIRSTSFLYTPRPGDFRREGDAWIASDSLGPGDLEAVPGFVWSWER